MIDWKIWFETGVSHILDIGGYDHMLFVALLCLIFPVNEWKKLLWLITAFTLGHSLTLILSVSGIIRLNQEFTEAAIVLTILITAIFRLATIKNAVNRGNGFYLIICCFGLVHGMGFSYLLKSMLGHNENIVLPLLMFNLGLETGQIIFVALFMIMLLSLSKLAPSQELKIRTVVTIIILLISLALCFIRIHAIFHS